MPTVAFTPNLQRHVPCPTETVDGNTVRQALDAVFAGNQRARSYVLDEHGAVRKHIVLFVNGRAIRDRQMLSDAVEVDDEIYVFQALSGG